MLSILTTDGLTEGPTTLLRPVSDIQPAFPATRSSSPRPFSLPLGHSEPPQKKASCLGEWCQLVAGTENCLLCSLSPSILPRLRELTMLGPLLPLSVMIPRNNMKSGPTDAILFPENVEKDLCLPHQDPLEATDKNMYCEQMGPHRAENFTPIAQLRPHHEG